MVDWLYDGTYYFLWCLLGTLFVGLMITLALKWDIRR